MSSIADEHSGRCIGYGVARCENPVPPNPKSRYGFGHYCEECRERFKQKARDGAR